MKKRLLSLLLALCMVLTLLPGTAWAAELHEFERQAALTSAGLKPTDENVPDEPGIMPYAATVDFELENGAVLKFEPSTFDPSTGAITNCIPNGATEINIPERIDGVSVTSIGDTAFSGCSGLTSVTIPNSVAFIGSNAFYNCSGLTSVTIPSGVISIGSSAFSGCSGLMSVTIPNSVRFIGHSAFFGCFGLTSVTIPSGVISIGSSAFSGCSGLTSVTIPNSVTSIGDAAFSGCFGLTSVTIPNSVTSIGDSAFWGCIGLTSVTIPNSVTSIGDSAFFSCIGLTSVTIPNSVTSIGDAAFSGCSGLTSVTIPNNVTSIGDSVFSSCSGLTSVVIPDCITSIGGYAFFGCSGLTSVTIPSSVTSIGDFAFGGCSGLTSVTIPNSVTSIGDAVFSGCSGLTSVTIPNSVTSIGVMAFYSCSGLTSVVIPDSVTSIENETFSGCRNLTNVAIPNSVTSIGDLAFDGCIGLTSVTIPNSVTSIGKGAFYFCSGLTSVVIPKSVTSIEEGAFDVCSILTIYCYKDSTAHHYAVEQDIPFVLLDEIPLHTVIFDSQGGSAVSVQTIPEGMCAVKPANPSKEGYIFNGWYTDPACTIPYQFDEPVMSDITLYACWDCEPEEVGSISITFWENEDYTNEITSMYTTYGSFSWGDVDAVSTGVSYDSAYIRIDYEPLSFGERLEGTITAPKGFSFSAEKLESDWVFSVSAEDQQPSVKIYPIYEESYHDNDILTFWSEITKISSDGTTTLKMTSIDTIPVYQNPHSGEVYYRDSFTETLTGPMDMGNLDFSIFTTASSTAPYNQDLARLSAALSMAVYKEIGIQATFRNLGFSNIMTFSYNPANDQIVLDRDIVASAFATKKYIIDGDIYTIIAVVMRGTVQDEWYSNFDIGSGDTIHVGFNNGKKEVLDKLDAYRVLLERNHVETGNVKILVTGHSRGAAVADLVTLELNNNSKYAEYAYNDIFAYTFAAPHSIPTSMRCENTDNIYNIINDQDLVSHVPGAFYSPGYNLYMNCYDDPLFNQFQEKFDELVRTASYKRWERLGIAVLKLFDFMPVENLSGEYGTLMADLMRGKISPESWIKIITTYDEKVLDWIVAFVSGSEDEIAKDIVYFLGAVSIASVSREYVEERIRANHAMETYMCWLNVISDGRGFSKVGFNDSIQQEASNGALLEMLTILKIRCPVNVYVYDENQNHRLVTSIENNTVTLDAGPFCLVSGEEKIFYLGNDDSYTFEIVGYDEGQMDIEVTEFGEDGQQTKFILYDDLPVEPQAKAVFTAENCATKQSYFSLVMDDRVQIDPDYFASGDQIGTLELSISIEGSGYVVGAGHYTPGETAFLYALSDESNFDGWYQDGNLISSEELYEFTILESVELVAKFVNQPAEHTHSWAKDWTNNKTHHWHECTAPGCGITSDSGKDGYTTHTSGEWIIDQAATSITAGQQHKECTVCGYVMETETIPATGGGISGGGGGSTPSNPSYQITVPTTSNGTVTVTPTSAKSGATVTITATPNDGYTTDSVIVTDSSGKSISVTDNGDGTYTFTMPSSKVTATATFAAIETPWVNPFTDVSESDWFYNEMAYVVQNGLMIGVGNQHFNPSGTTSRGMIVTILYRLEGEPAVPQSTFTDVEAGQWYTDAVAWAAANKIVEGYGNNTFGPNDDITREQMATILYRYADYKGYDVSGLADLSSYTDTDKISNWALTAIRWANKKGFITGRTTTTLVPKGTTTRAEAAVILARVCQDVAGLD